MIRGRGRKTERVRDSGSFFLIPKELDSWPLYRVDRLEVNDAEILFSKQQRVKHCFVVLEMGGIGQSFRLETFLAFDEHESINRKSDEGENGGRRGVRAEPARPRAGR